MDNINKSSLEEAKANFQEIKKFATEAVKKEFEGEINQKIDKLLKESLSVDVDDENNITISTEEKVVEVKADGEVEVEDKSEHEEEIEVGDGKENFDDEEEIEIEKNIDEMIQFEEEQVPAEVGTPEVAPESTPEATPEEMPADAPVEESPIDDSVMKLAQDIVAMIDKTVEQKMSGQASDEQGVDVDYIDDEANAAPEAAPATPATPATPVQEEDDLLEFSLEEIGGGMEDDYIEFDDIEDLGDKKKEDDLFEFEIAEEEEDALEEIKGVGKVVRNTSSRLGLEPREGTPNLNESAKKIKVQYESKLGELTKENKRLNESNKELGDVIKNYQESFVDLRKQFDEMQTFNAKLAYANKIFASGGLSTTDKAKIAEAFDKTQTVDEAKKLYNKILEENKISINKDNSSKIKAPATNNIKAKEVVYESADMKRRKVLAGIEKNEDFI